MNHLAEDLLVLALDTAVGPFKPTRGLKKDQIVVGFVIELEVKCNTDRTARQAARDSATQHDRLRSENSQ
ncbi:MAG: hypothetical protein Phog2KO_49920 [Phototrophicaceae bacterium]